MGEEAVLETDRFTLNDTSMLLVRQAVQRVRYSGYTALIRRFTELDEQQRQQVAEDISASRLYHFNLKFAPLWVPHFLATEPTLAMVNVMFAAGMAEGFLPNLSARRLQDQSRFFLQVSWMLFTRCNSLLWKSFLKCRLAIRLSIVCAIWRLYAQRAWSGIRWVVIRAVLASLCWVFGMP